jgi:hypothetical protein
LGVTLVACGSTTSAVGDAGPDAHGIKTFDAAVVDQSTPFGDSASDVGPSSSCGTVDVSAFTPTWQNDWQTPTAFAQNRCSPTEISDYVTKCLWYGYEDPSSCVNHLTEPSSLDCLTCLAPNSGSTGPFRWGKDACGLTPSFNIGGCLSNALGSSCGSAWMSANQCAEVACSLCACGGGEDQFDYMHPCIAAGGNSGCDNLHTAAACAYDSTSPVVKTCFAAIQPKSTADMTAFANLFCGTGPGPVDAGTD